MDFSLGTAGEFIVIMSVQSMNSKNRTSHFYRAPSTALNSPGFQLNEYGLSVQQFINDHFQGATLKYVFLFSEHQYILYNVWCPFPILFLGIATEII